MPKDLEGDYESNCYTYLISQYVGNITKMEFMERRELFYDIMVPFISQTLVDEYAFKV